MSRLCFIMILSIFILSACSNNDNSNAHQSEDRPTEEVRTDEEHTDETRAEEENTELSTESTQNLSSKSYGITFKKFACPNIHCTPLIVNIVDNKMLLKSGREPNSLSKTLYLDDVQIQALEQKIKALDLKSMNTVIKPGTTSCPSYSTDQPSYQLSLTKGNFNQVFEAYAGCQLKIEQLGLIDWFLSFDQKALKTGDF